MTLLAGKRVLITGGSTGIGAAAAVEAARQGADVAINYASSEARAQQVIAQIEAWAARVWPCRAMSPIRPRPRIS
jgi:L-rhamnose 1-dehydrogenase